MNAPKHPLITGARVTGLGTLVSRVLGMIRDMAMAALWGLTSGGVADAFVFAYRIPNLFRRLFGEGALTASYLPVLSAELERDPQNAWRLASVLITWLAAFLAVLVLLGEGIFALIWLIWGHDPGIGLLMGLSAVLFPYLLLICLAAQLTATLHALSHFSIPALTPVILNVCWLTAIWLVWVCPCFEDKQAQAYVIAAAVIVAGVLQIAVQLPVLRRLGFRFEYHWPASRDAIRKIGRALAPMLFGLAVTQINTFFDSLIAWGLTAPAEGAERIAWLGGVRYPMQQGAVAAIYYGERLYHFPLGVLGLAVAAAIFPLLSRHAARGDREKLGSDLTLGLRLVVCLGVPAGVGLIMLAEPLARLLFEHGAFTPEDTARTARMIACYGAGVWAFCALPAVIRGFYALGDTATPVRTAAAIVGLNLTLNLTLIWPLAEAGLAVATSISAAVQVLVLMLIFSRRKSRLQWLSLGRTALQTLLATALMAAAGYAVLAQIAYHEGLPGEILRVLLPLGASVAVYCTAFRLVGGRELGLLVRGASDDE